MHLQIRISNFQRRRAFTLIELLIVIALIAVLTAILLPAINLMTETSRRVVCLGNLHQMALACGAYTSANEGQFPIAYDFDDDGVRSYSHAWDFTTITQPGQPQVVIAGLLWPGQSVSKIQQCPSFDGSANWIADPYTGYNYNTSYIGHGQFETVPTPAKIGQIPNPAGTALFGDGQYIAGANKLMRAPWPSPGDADFVGRWAGTQGFRHAGQTNVAFCDGHAQTLGSRFTSNQDGAANVAAGTGFLSSDNALYGGD
jgi:prepilin-type N-terminal cleavage/methylation domain-containing protein/prepilin-type processing-associated H-X9-DG protein